MNRYYDSVNAVVCDLGSQSFRVGLARRYMPTVEVATSVGVPAAALEPDVKRDGRINKTMSGRFEVDVTSLCVPREDGVEMVNCIRNRMIDDWDMFEMIFDYAFDNYVRSEPRRHPLLFTEPPLNWTADRERLAELMFEKYGAPCMCLCADAVLAAFAFSGHNGTAMVVDSGATHTSAVPVCEGRVIADCVSRSPLAGNFIGALCKHFFDMNEIDIVPRYVIGQSFPVKTNENPVWTKKTTLPQVTKSWHDYMCDLVIQDFQQSVLEVPEIPYDEKKLLTFPKCHYKFPNGYNQEFGIERFQIPESLFISNPYASDSVTSISHMVATSIEMCEENLKSTMYENIIVIGGNSLLKGFSMRLSEDISAYKPTGIHQKITTPIRPIDRQYGAWLGGSLIATDETADDMWFSSHEYNEFGKSYINYKCP